MIKFNNTSQEMPYLIVKEKYDKTFRLISIISSSLSPVELSKWKNLFDMLSDWEKSLSLTGHRH